MRQVRIQLTGEAIQQVMSTVHGAGGSVSTEGSYNLFLSAG